MHRQVGVQFLQTLRVFVITGNWSIMTKFCPYNTYTVFSIEQNSIYKFIVSYTNAALCD